MQIISVYKGKSHWREWEFWLIFAFWCVSVAFVYYWRGEIIGALPVSFIYLWMLLPRQTWLIGDYLVSMGPRLLGVRKIKDVRGIHVSESGDKLMLDTTWMVSSKLLKVEIEISQGTEQERFLAQIEKRGVPVKFEVKPDWEATQKSLDVLLQSMSSHDSEAEREALYKLVGRTQPKG